MEGSEILQTMDTLFSDLNHVDLKQLESFIHEILKLFSHIQEKINSGNPKEREDAEKLAEELQKKLQNLSEKAFATSGLSEEKIQSILANPSNFSSSDWSTVKKIEKEMNDLQKTMSQKV